MLNPPSDEAPCGLYIDASCVEVVPATAYPPIPMIRRTGHVSGTVLQRSRLRFLDSFVRFGRPSLYRRRMVQLIAWDSYGVRDSLSSRGSCRLPVCSCGRRAPPQKLRGLVRSSASVALATLTLAFWKHGGRYVATEGRSMIIGAIALAVYSFLICQLLMRVRSSALTATAVATIAWLLLPSASNRRCWGRR